MADHQRVLRTLSALNTVSRALGKLKDGDELFGEVFEISEEDQRHIAIAEGIVRREQLDLALSSGMIDVDAVLAPLIEGEPN